MKLLLFILCSLGVAPKDVKPDKEIANPVVEVASPSTDTIVTTKYTVVKLSNEKEVSKPPPVPQIILEWAIPLDSNTLHYPFLLIKAENNQKSP